MKFVITDDDCDEIAVRKLEGGYVSVVINDEEAVNLVPTQLEDLIYALRYFE